jgi:hypothetical protein
MRVPDFFKTNDDSLFDSFPITYQQDRRNASPNGIL